MKRKLITSLFLAFSAGLLSGQTANLSGLILSPCGEGIPDAVVSVDNNYTFSNASGAYLLTGIPVPSTAAVCVDIDINPLNGMISTGVDLCDYMALYKHILGLEQLPSSLGYIAGDINQNGSVTAFDAVVIQSQLLGKYDFFNIVYPYALWRTVPLSVLVQNPTGPLNASSCSSFAVTGTQDSVDVVVVKAGDTNLSSFGCNIPPAGLPIDISCNEQIFSPGEIVVATLTTSQPLQGFQANVQANGLLIDSITGTTVTDFFINRFMWAAPQLNAMQPEIKVYMHATAAGSLSNNFSLMNKIGYNNGCVEVSGITIFGVSGINEINTPGLNVEITPNPWGDNSTLLVTAVQREAAVLDLYDISGKLIHHRSLQLLEGENRLSLHAADCPPTGLILYRLSTATGSSTGKMIRLK